MAEYIEREAAICIANYAVDESPYDKNPMKPETLSEYSRGWNAACDYIRDKLETAPAADVAPVVRCKDCKYGEFVKRGSKYSCRKVEGFLNFCDFYCKDGVKKEGDT